MCDETDKHLADMEYESFLAFRDLRSSAFWVYISDSSVNGFCSNITGAIRQQWNCPKTAAGCQIK